MPYGVIFLEVSFIQLLWYLKYGIKWLIFLVWHYSWVFRVWGYRIGTLTLPNLTIFIKILLPGNKQYFFELYISIVSFVSACSFVMMRKPPDMFKCVINITLLQWLFRGSWSCWQIMFVGKTCNAKLTSNNPLCYTLHIQTVLLKWIKCVVLALELHICKETAVWSITGSYQIWYMA